MSGPGPGPWQQDGERALGHLRLGAGLIDAAVLNPSKSIAADWLYDAATELDRARVELAHAIQGAKPGRASAELQSVPERG